jgi:hypothetical protein
VVVTALVVVVMTKWKTNMVVYRVQLDWPHVAEKKIQGVI